MSPRDHFSQAMQNPYFQTDAYLKETVSGRAEVKIENWMLMISKKIRRKK